MKRVLKAMEPLDARERMIVFALRAQFGNMLHSIPDRKLANAYDDYCFTKFWSMDHKGFAKYLWENPP